MKKKTIIRAKEASWKAHLASLEDNRNASKFWNFTKYMMKGPADPLTTTMPLIHNGSQVTDNKDKANLFLRHFTHTEEDDMTPDAAYVGTINDCMMNTDHLNSAFQMIELERCVRNLPNKAIG